MLARYSTIFGLGLLGLWIAGLTVETATPWMAWIDGVTAVAAFFVAVYSSDWPKDETMPPHRDQNGSLFSLLLSIVLLGSWMLGLAGGSDLWQSWFQFAFGVAFLALGITASVQRPEIRRHEPKEKETETVTPFRRSA